MLEFGGYAEELQNVFDSISGVRLDQELSSASRKPGIDFMSRLDVHRKRPRNWATDKGIHVIPAKWVDVNNGDAKQRRALGRDINPVVDVESVITPPSCLDEGQFHWSLTPGFQEVPENKTSGSWTVTRSRPWRWTESVDIGKPRSLVEAPRPRAQVLLLGENIAVCLAFERRRAASFRRVIRCFAFICLSNKLRISVRWVPSERKAADHPSRNFHGEEHRTSCATSDSTLPELVSTKENSAIRPITLVLPAIHEAGCGVSAISETYSVF